MIATKTIATKLKPLALASAFLAAPLFAADYTIDTQGLMPLSISKYPIWV